ncbi:MAG: cytochrome c [Pseudolabrys sp.]|jgi:mono/diheme cytochrome c family protein|nr:cytochrome c [Pseudolabrys sp.]
MLIKAMMVAAAAAPVLAGVAWAADAGRGRALAQQRCAGCHNIDGGARSARRSAPSFSEIARQSGFSADQLSITLTYGHVPMGDGRVGPGEAGDLAAYIVSLRRR